MRRAEANPYPWPQRKKSAKLRWPMYRPDHGEPFIAPETMTREDWQKVRTFAAYRRSSALVDLSDRVRAQIEAAMPELERYLNDRRIDPFWPNRPHTILRRSERARAPKPTVMAPPAGQSMDTLEQLLRRSIERTNRGA